MQLLQEFVHIGVAVVSVRKGIACRVYAGSSVERVDFQSRIVGKDVEPVAFVDKARFQQGIALEGVGRFGDVLVAIDVGQ